MRHRRPTLFFLMIVGLWLLAAPTPATAQRFCRGFGYGNLGYAAGYSTYVTRRAAWCGPGWGWGPRFAYGCGPRWVCRPRVCSPCQPWGGGWYGWPGYGFGGWYGSSWYSGVQSVYLATPAGGGAVFFSGSIVPYPVPYAVPYAVPSIGPFGAPWLGAAPTSRAGFVPVGAIAAASVPAAVPAVGQRPAAIAARPAALPRLAAVVSSTPAGRLRARALVATGDRDLATSAGDRAKLAAAAAAYGRAAVAAKDDPDIHVRHAIALAALGRQAEATAAGGRALALDGRLAYRPGERAADAPSPVVERGLEILRQLAAEHGEQARETLVIVADRWAGRPGGALAALVANDPPTR